MKKIKITLTLNNGEVRQIREAYETHAIADGACPGCKTTSFRVAGCGKSIDPDHRLDTYRADAVCIDCAGHVGIIRAKIDTLFGIEEDSRVFSMGVRVY